jgi:membrane-anchored protein YejM (alkaline phosphatase superfamily)
MPPIAWNRGLGHNALDSYKDANQYPLHPNTTFPDPLVKAMRRGYRAAVAYMDWMTGNVLQALNTSSAVDNTVVVFMGGLFHTAHTNRLVNLLFKRENGEHHTVVLGTSH